MIDFLRKLAILPPETLKFQYIKGKSWNKNAGNDIFSWPVWCLVYCKGFQILLVRWSVDWSGHWGT